MLIELFIFWEIVMLGLFIASFFTKQEILWAITLVLSGVLMFTSWNIETYVYEFNQTIGVYQPVAVNYSYGYLMAINMLFFVLALLLGIFDLFDKYGTKFLKRKKQ
jgi:hypothetical protein